MTHLELHSSAGSRNNKRILVRVDAINTLVEDDEGCSFNTNDCIESPYRVKESYEFVKGHILAISQKTQEQKENK